MPGKVKNLNKIIKEEFVTYNNISLQYFVYGSGKNHLVTLHGFGRDYKDFMFFEDLTKNYTVIGINLFFHGASIFPEERTTKSPLTKSEWQSLFKLIIEKEKVLSFSIISYSMGGKFAFCLLEEYFNCVKKVVFLAPDGVVENPWYKFVTQTSIGKRVSKKFVSNDFLISQFFNYSTKLKLTNPNLKKFVEFNVSTLEKRELIYKVWQSFKLIKPNHNVIKSKISKGKLFVVLGKKDVAIKANYAKVLNKIYGDLVKVEILNLGHNLYKTEVKPVILNFLT